MARLAPLLILLSALLVSPDATAQARKALVGGTLIDGYGGAPVHDSVILVEGETITAVGREGAIDVPVDAEIISTEGMTVLPGLWEMHAHLMLVGHSDYAYWDSTYTGEVLSETIMPAAAEQLLYAGITSARDLGAPLEEILTVRDRINAGELPGPTMYVSGPFLQDEPYPGTEGFRWGIDGVDDARHTVRQLAEAGVDFIKLVDQDRMQMDAVRAVVDEAHAHGLPVVAHSHRPEEIRRGLAVGVDNFEHTGLATAPAYPDDVMAMLKDATAQRQVFWTPTISPLLLFEYTRDYPERIDDPRWHRGLPDSVIADVRASLAAPGQLPYYQLMPQRRPTLQRKFDQLDESGAILLIGTDSGVPLNFHSDATWRELDYWVNMFGVDPMDAIRAATYWPAVMMGVEDEVGTIAPGMTADIIAVRGNPLRHIGLLQDIDLVMKHGERVK
jgi:imidazolonepropionase-like amidohydrolase